MNILDLSYFFIFIFAVFSFGNIFLSLLNIHLSPWGGIIVGVNLGIVFLTIIAFFLGILNLSILLFPMISVSLGYQLWKVFKGSHLTYFRIDFLLVLVIFLAVLIQSIVNITSFISNDQYRLLGAHSRDSLWHISIINNVIKNIPPENPLFAGVEFTNYHYFIHLFIAGASKITTINVFNLYFQYIPVFLLTQLALTLFILVKEITNRWVGYFAVIFFSLSSSLYFLVPLIYPQAYLHPGNLWIDEYSTRMVNLQLLSSYLIILTLLVILLKKESFNILQIIIFSFISGALFGFKSQGAIIWLSALSFLGLINIFRQNLKYLFLSTGTIIVTFMISIFTTKIKHSIFIIEPLWFIKTMFESSTHLNHVDWELKRQTYLNEGNLLRITQLYIDGLLVFIIFNFGPRLLGFLNLINLKNIEKRQKDIILLLLFISLIGIVLPLVVVTAGVAWNSIQFSYYSILSLSILTSILIFRLSKINIKLSVITAVLIWLLLLPGVFYTTQAYLPKEFSKDDIFSAVTNLASKKDGTILAHPNFDNNAFIPSISKKSLYFANDPSLDVQLIDFSERRNNVKEFFETTDQYWQLEFLKANQIKYVISDKKIKLYKYRLLDQYPNLYIYVFED